MTTNNMYHIEMYRVDQMEDSDPDPVHEYDSDNTDDLFTELSAWANCNRYEYLDSYDSDVRYKMFDASNQMIGVAIITYPKAG